MVSSLGFHSRELNSIRIWFGQGARYAARLEAFSPLQRLTGNHRAALDPIGVERQAEYPQDIPPADLDARSNNANPGKNGAAPARLFSLRQSFAGLRGHRR